MKLLALELRRFGAMRDRVLRLAESRPFHVAFGPNEAGKSTTKRALVALLYGIGNQDADAALFHAETKVAGVFATDVGPLRLTRHKRLRAPFVTDDAGQARDELFEQLQRGWSREAYERSFAIDHERLRAFASALSSHGPLSALASAELGGLDVGAMQRSLDDAAARLSSEVATRSKKREIALALEELKKVETELQAHIVSPSRVGAMRDAMNAQELLLAARRDEERLAEHEVWKALQREQLSKEAAALADLQHRATAGAPTLLISEEQLAQARALAAHVERTEAECARLSRELTQLMQQLDAQPTDAPRSALARSISEEARALDHLERQVEALAQTHAANADAQQQLALAETELISLGLGPSLPTDAGWLQHVERWANAVQSWQQHQSDSPLRAEPVRSYTEDDLGQLERALARAELAASPDARHALEERLARAERDYLQWSSESTHDPRAFNLADARHQRDAPLRTHVEENRPAAPSVVSAWLQEAARIDAASDALLQDATQGARLAEAKRASASARDLARAEHAAFCSQAEEQVQALRAALRALDVVSPTGFEATLAKAREACERLRRAVAKSHEDARRREQWVHKEALLAAELAALNATAFDVWNCALGVKHYGLAMKVRTACERYAVGFQHRERCRVADELQRERTQAAMPPIPAFSLAIHETPGSYLRRVSDLRTGAAQTLAADAQQAQLRAQVEATKRAYTSALDSARDAKAQCEGRFAELQAVSLAQLESARGQTRAHEEVLREVASLESSIAAGAARIELRLADARVPSELAQDMAAAARARRDEAHRATLEATASLATLRHAFEQGAGEGVRAVELAERRAQASARIEELLARYVPLRAASHLLRAALLRHRDARLAPLLEAASRYMKCLSNGAYDRVSLSDSDEEPVLQVSSSSELARSVMQLSDGTRDQLGLAARLAYEELQHGDAPLPLVLDDVLVHFDDERAASALRALSALCTKRPLLLLTHHQHVVDLARAHVPAELLDVTGLQPLA